MFRHKQPDPRNAVVDEIIESLRHEPERWVRNQYSEMENDTGIVIHVDFLVSIKKPAPIALNAKQTSRLNEAINFHDAWSLQARCDRVAQRLRASVENRKIA